MFTAEHFELLNKWRDQRKTPGDGQAQDAYDELKNAYKQIEVWANGLQKKCFPDGRVTLRQKPTNQAGNFSSYLWAKIYPSRNSPDWLAFTVSIDCDNGFLVKIDITQSTGEDKKERFLAIKRRRDEQVPFRATLTANDGFNLSMEHLIQWSVNEVEKFEHRYAEIVSELNTELRHQGNSPIQRSLKSGVVELESNYESHTKNIIYYGPPGTGKTFEIQKILDNEYTDEEYTDKELRQRYEFVTFHQSYGYEEFVEGLRPVIDESNRDEHLEDSTDSNNSGQVRYEIKPGAFLRLCERARKNPSQRFAMVIDEINRGNVSKIFGELITLVELDKRAGTENAISATLPYSGKSFSVPMNVDVIGTMNTADRSLALVDTALRRRFEFIESMPNPSTLEGVVVSKGGKDIDIKKLLTTINKRIEALYNRDHTIGHAYFTHLKKLNEEERFSELKKIFQYKIIPLLEEYFFEDWQKIRLVLGDNQKRNKDQQFVQEIGRGDDLVELFGQDHGLNQHAIRSRYQLNVNALDSLGAYIGIYDPTDL